MRLRRLERRSFDQTVEENTSFSVYEELKLAAYSIATTGIRTFSPPRLDLRASFPGQLFLYHDRRWTIAWPHARLKTNGVKNRRRFATQKYHQSNSLSYRNQQTANNDKINYLQQLCTIYKQNENNDLKPIATVSVDHLLSKSTSK